MNMTVEYNQISSKYASNNIHLISENNECNYDIYFYIANIILNFTSNNLENKTEGVYNLNNKKINKAIQLRNFNKMIFLFNNSKYQENKISIDTFNISNYNSSITKDKNNEKLYDIRKLKYNWNYNEAEPIDKIICDNVAKILEEVIIQPKIFPTANDSIQLEYYDNKDKNKYLEFEVFKNNINVYEVISNLEEKSYIINSISTNKINSIIMDFYELNRK